MKKKKIIDYITVHQTTYNEKLIPSIKGNFHVVYNDREIYVVNGMFHRICAPAIIMFNGEHQYWLRGKVYEYRDYWQKMFDRKLIEKRELMIRLV